MKYKIVSESNSESTVLNGFCSPKAAEKGFKKAFQTSIEDWNNTGLKNNFPFYLVKVLLEN
jgi:hypothetical protein